MPHAVYFFAIYVSHLASGYLVNLSAIGPLFSGLGAQSTAGTARLLIDYSVPQRNAILDFLFKPQYGASLQHLKVEIGGDAQISCGAEASGQRTADVAPDWGVVGYEGWLMAEAKKRNSNLLLLGLVYAWPSWVNPNGSSPFVSPQTEANAAMYVTNWVRGMTSIYNLSIDYVGLWNEREFTTSYVITLRDSLDAAGFAQTKIVASDRFWDPFATDYMSSSALRNATAALTQHYPNCDADGHGNQCPSTISPNAVAANLEFGAPLFSSEDYSCFSDDNSAVHWASKLNSNFIGGNITFFSVWYLLTAFYPSVAFWNDGLLRATQPWGGHFDLTPTLWATAHYTQYTQPHGWHYLTQGLGSGKLDGGGTFVTIVDALGNVTIVIEAAGATGALSAWSSANCNAVTGLNFLPAAAPQNATFVLSGSDFAIPRTLALWRSRFQRGSRTVSSLFERMPDVAVAAGGELNLTVEPDTVYTLSTFPGASKAAPVDVPPSSPFPLPFSDDFESLPPGRPGKFWADMHGGFQIAPSAIGGKGQVLRQAVPLPACCNFIQSLGGPLGVSILGSATWSDVEISVDIAVATGFAFVGVRAQFVRGFFDGGLTTPGGIFLAISVTDWCLVFDVASLCGISQGQGGCSMWKDVCVLQGLLPSRSGNVTQVTVGARGTAAWVMIAGSPLPGLANFSLPRSTAAYAGAGFVAVGGTWTDMEFDNVLITETVPPPAPLTPGSVLRGLPCGDPASEAGSVWAASSGSNSTYLFSLASNANLCLAPSDHGTTAQLTPCDPTAANQMWHVTDTSLVNTASGLCVGAKGGAFPGSLSIVTLSPCEGALKVYWSPATGYLHTQAQDPLAMVCLGAWYAPLPPPPPLPPPQAAAFAVAGKGVTIPKNGANATWVSNSCNHVALLNSASKPSSWIAIVSGAASFIDIGFCTPDISLNINGPTDWMGYATGKAWVYRASGLYRTAAPPPEQGVPYGLPFGEGDVITMIRLSGSQIEFLLNNASQGIISLPDGIPANVIGCAGICAPGSAATLSTTLGGAVPE